MKLFTTKQKGDIGEKFTERYLKKSGYKILERNYRQKCGEIDIIAQKGEYIIFTEVKQGRQILLPVRMRLLTAGKSQE